MNIQPFDPIAPGEIDTFVFDFTRDAGLAEIVASSWSCALLPAYLTGADPNPQAHILNVAATSMVQQPARLPELPLQMLRGQFSVAEIGGFPPAAAGSWYVLTATVTLNDGRVLEQSANILCLY
jgi:hypothetical protein